MALERCLIFINAKGGLTGNDIRLPIPERKEAKEKEMAAKDAEMPAHHALTEEIQEIAKHLGILRKDIEGLTGSIKRAGGHQAERAQDAAGEALGAIEAAVQRNPAQTLGIALGIGLIIGVVLRR
jgi:ElaB/YqjD/DUF883 family membrane-anchored ribosome-binding protein